MGARNKPQGFLDGFARAQIARAFPTPYLRDQPDQGRCELRHQRQSRQRNALRGKSVKKMRHFLPVDFSQNLQRTRLKGDIKNKAAFRGIWPYPMAAHVMLHANAGRAALPGDNHPILIQLHRIQPANQVAISVP